MLDLPVGRKRSTHGTAQEGDCPFTLFHAGLGLPILIVLLSPDHSSLCGKLQLCIVRTSQAQSGIISVHMIDLVV